MAIQKPLYWHQGLFLQPHHFQQQDLTFQTWLTPLHAYAQPHFWGVGEFEIHRAALGATESVAWTYYPAAEAAVMALKSEGYRIIGLEQTDESISLASYVPTNGTKLALVFGNEVSGLSEGVLPLLDDCLEIPQFGTKHSFNVAVSAGIVLWDLFMKTNIIAGVT